MAIIIPRRWRGTWEGVPMATWCSEWICRTWGGLGPHILIFPASKFVISPADARCYNKSCTNNSSRWLVLQEYPILSNLQFCRPLGGVCRIVEEEMIFLSDQSNTIMERVPRTGLFLSFFLGFRRPNLITGLAECEHPISHLGPKNLSYLCITNLLCLRHRLIFHHWWHLSPQSLCHQQGLLLWCLLLCVIMWFQRIQREW